MNHIQLSLAHRLRSLQSTGITIDQQEQFNMFIGGATNNEARSFLGDMGEVDRNSRQDHQSDLAPLPLTAFTTTGVDPHHQQALDELCRTLSDGDHPFEAVGRASSNEDFAINPVTGMYSASTPSLTYLTQFQNQLFCQRYNPNNLSQLDQGGIVFPAFAQDGATASPLSSEALMNSLLSSNLSALNRIHVKSSSNPPPMPLVHRPVEIEPVRKPVKALSAYNFFFRDQRDKILHGAEEDYSAEKQEELLAGQ
jgi:hypothetical protein